jgi:hypothetical protein
VKIPLSHSPDLKWARVKDGLENIFKAYPNAARPRAAYIQLAAEDGQPNVDVAALLAGLSSRTAGN